MVFIGIASSCIVSCVACRVRLSRECMCPSFLLILLYDCLTKDVIHFINNSGLACLLFW